METLRAKRPKVRQARAALRSSSERKRAAVLEELECIAAAEITDVVQWDAQGRVQFLSSSELSTRARKAIKKVKVTPTQYGNQVEVELHDKQPALRLLAKHHALLEPAADKNRPSLIGINIKGPEVTTYEVVDENAKS